MRYFIFILLLIGTFTLKGQCFAQLKEKALQPPALPSGYVVLDVICQYNLYYVAYGKKNGSAYDVIYHYWQDNAWHTISEASFTGDSYPYLLAWDGRIFGSALMTKVNNIQAPAGQIINFIEFKNGAWDTLAGGIFNDYVYKYQRAYSTNTGMYYTARKDSSQTGPTNLYYYDTLSHRFKKVMNYYSYSSSISDFATTAGNNHLMVCGYFWFNGQLKEGIARVKGSSLYNQPVVAGTNYYTYAIDGSNDHIYYYGGARGDQRPPVIEYDEKDSLVGYHETSNVTEIGKMIAHKGQLLIGWHYNNYDYYSTLCKDDQYWTKPNFKNGALKNTTTYACASGIFFQIQATGQVLEFQKGAQLLGQVYVDIDANCQFDATKDRLVKDYPIKVRTKSHQLSTSTNHQGVYTMGIPIDTVKIELENADTNCASNTIVANKEGEIDTLLIALKKPTTQDAALKAYQFYLARWNGRSSMRIEFDTKGLLFDSAWYEWRIDQRVKLDNLTDPSIVSVNNHVIRGRYYKLGYFERRSMTIYYLVDTSQIKLGDTLAHALSCGLFVNESDTNNNRLKLYQKVVYSRDPNHITCDKDSIAKWPNTTLTYRIDFQNEGGADAIDVILNNTLPYQLDANTFQLLEASHPCAIETNNSNLRVEFKAIHLKPKDSSEQLSKGYLIYSVNTKQALLPHDSILNKVGIVFDLNPAITTNTAKVFVTNDSLTSNIQAINHTFKGLMLYPNPASHQINLITDAYDPVLIYDVLGQVYFYSENAVGLLKVNVQSWPTGIYIVRCGSNYQKFIKTDGGSQ